jgi:HEXXH motif-containing protein
MPYSEVATHALDAAVRAGLADSLAHVHEVVAATHDLGNFDLDAVLTAIRSHRVPPGVFGRYYDLVFAVQDRRYPDAVVLFREIEALADQRPNLAVIPFSAEALQTDVERYARLLSLETGSWAALAPPAMNEWQSFRENVAAALEVIEEADSSLSAELRTLVIQIVGMGRPADPSGRSYAGLSSFMLWGAVLLSIRQHPTVLDVVAGLVHEAAHQLLFGVALDEPLVENAIEERYGSPLRKDPRPMDGIFHATFVCARMHYGYAHLLDCSASATRHLDRDVITERLG